MANSSAAAPSKQWREVVSEALQLGQERFKTGVPGAALRSLIARSARKREMAFPPSEEFPRFQDFLVQFADLLTILPRPGQDFLVVPADTAKGHKEQKAAVVIRQDLFDAFTHFVNDGKAFWYNATTDAVETWPETSKPDETLLHAIPTPSPDDELKLRQQFIQAQTEDNEARSELKTALDDAHPFGTFSRVVRKHSLGREWHRFRSQAVLERIRGWASKNDIAWRVNWIVGSDLQRGEDQPSIPAARSESTSRDKLRQLIEKLSDDDLSRVQVPLDLVVKLTK